MQFICEVPLHRVVRSETRALHDTRGQMVQTRKRRVFAKFQRGGLPPWALDEALKKFEFRSKPPEQPVEGWASFYDSEADQIRWGWDDEERAAIETALQNTNGVYLIERPRLPLPYPKFNQHRKTAGKRTLEHVIKDLQATYETAGFDVGLAIAYERENLNDPAVVAALEALVETEPVDAEEQVIAA